MIDVACACGRKWRVPHVHGGKAGKCAGCGAVIAIPMPPPDDQDDVEPVRLPCDWEYKVAQCPPTIAIAAGASHARVAADFLEKALNKFARDGWEFFRIDTIGVRETPGCLAAMFGAGPTTMNYYVITFRRPRAG